MLKSIPDTADFRPLFWDTDMASIDIYINKNQVIQRILNYGNEITYRWMFRVYLDEDVIHAVKHDKNINRRSAVMVANYYGIPKEELACMNNASSPSYYPY